jgi:hypothetical protein
MTTPVSVTIVERSIKYPKGSPRNSLARIATKTGYELHITAESPSGMNLRE